MKNVFLIANGTSENHGCEAIMQATSAMIGNKFDKIYCSTTHLKYEVENTKLPSKGEWCEYSYYRKPNIPNRIISKSERMIFKSNKYAEKKPWLDNVLKIYKQKPIVLSVGGDNYCNGSYEWLYSLHNYAKMEDLKTILWGASIGKGTLYNKAMCDDLQKYEVICARESLSYNIAKEIHSNVKLFPDPAFLLDTVEKEWAGYEECDIPEFIGINISPTTIACETQTGILLENYCTLIEYILKETQYHIALIPHVIYQKKWGDYEVLRHLYNKYAYTKRIILIEDCNCFELKGYIGRCKMFFTARTHASIAAYSCSVPTIVLGYSIKADGIATDIFGTKEHYVLPVNEIDNKKELVKEFVWLADNYDMIRKHLVDKMPSYKHEAEQAVKVFDEI